MMVTSLHCPNCGAPLPPKVQSGLAVCLYCNATVRIQPDEATSPETIATVEARLDAERMAEIKQMLLAGHRSEALQCYQQLTGAGDVDAEQAVGDLGRQLTVDIVRHQNLTPYGVLMVILWAVVFIGAGAAGLAGRLHPLLAILATVFAGWNLFFYYPAVRTTLRYMGAPVALANTLKLAPIGQFYLRGRTVHAFKVWLEVRPKAGQPFQAEMILPVREKNLPRAREGEVIQVKYLPNRPGQVIYFQKG
jgi:hypothetical protein